MDGDQDIGLSERMTGGLSGPALVGAELRERRERLGWSKADVASRLRIRLAFVEAIEEGDLAALPAPAYAAGFIRSYAEALELDPDEVLRRFRAEGMNRKAVPVLSFPEAPPERGIPPGALALVAAILAISGYAIWYYVSSHNQRLVDRVPPVPANLAALTLPLPPPMPHAPAPSPPPPSSEPSPGQVTETLLPPLRTVTPKPDGEAIPAKLPLPPPPEPEAAYAVAHAKPEQPRLPMPPAPPSAAALTAARLDFARERIAALKQREPERRPAEHTPAAPRSNSIVVIATSRTWVQIRDIHGKILFSRVMLPGESWPLPNEPGLTLTTGNAGGTALISNGVPGPPLGPSGAVVRNVLITPSGTVVPPLPSPQRRHSDSHRQASESDPVNPFAISTTGDQ